MHAFARRSLFSLVARNACLLVLAPLAGCNTDKLPTAIQSSAVASNSVNDARDRALTVMTYNVYQGTELENSIAATTPQEFVIGATKDYLMMRQTNFSERAGAIAAEIAATEPDLIGLQEVALWRTGPHTDPVR